MFQMEAAVSAKALGRACLLYTKQTARLVWLQWGCEERLKEIEGKEGRKGRGKSRQRYGQRGSRGGARAEGTSSRDMQTGKRHGLKQASHGY